MTKYVVRVTFDDGTTFLTIPTSDYSKAVTRYYHLKSKIFDIPKLDVEILTSEV